MLSDAIVHVRIGKKYLRRCSLFVQANFYSCLLTVAMSISLLSFSKQPGENGKTPTTATNSSWKKKGRHYKIHAIPIAEEVNCPPSSYQYRVRMQNNTLQIVNASALRYVEMYSIIISLCIVCVVGVREF